MPPSPIKIFPLLFKITIEINGNIKNNIKLLLPTIKNWNSTQIKKNVEDWRLIPSNILHAFINNKKHNTVKKYEKFPNWIILFIKEKCNSEIKISLFKNIKLIKQIKNKKSLMFGVKFFLSSYNPIKKRMNPIEIKKINSYSFLKKIFSIEIKSIATKNR